MSTIAFFNNKGGVGKTSLVYHLGWMFAGLDYRVLAVDLDPQCNLSGMFLDDDALEEALEPEQEGMQTIHQAISPILKGTGDLKKPYLHETSSPELSLLIGDIALTSCEDELSHTWAKCNDGDERAFRVTTMFARLVGAAKREFEADIALVDVGPNLGAINRAALIACDYVVLPLGPDLFSLRGLRNVGEQLKTWRKEWQERKAKLLAKEWGFCPDVPEDGMQPVGYLVMRHSVRLSRPTKAYARWIERFPRAYRESVEPQQETKHDKEPPTHYEDPCSSPDSTKPRHCIAILKDYYSLMPMAQESHKPIFLLKPGDGVFGEHQKKVQHCYKDFKEVAESIAARCKIKRPEAD